MAAKVYKIKNESEKKRIIAILESLNVTLGTYRNYTPKEYFSEYDGCYVGVDNKKVATWSEGCTLQNYTLGEFLEDVIKSVIPESIEIKLNNSYTAVVYKDKIVVGCQEFPINVIDKLVEARNTVLNG